MVRRGSSPGPRGAVSTLRCRLATTLIPSASGFSREMRGPLISASSANGEGRHRTFSNRLRLARRKRSVYSDQRSELAVGTRLCTIDLGCQQVQVCAPLDARNTQRMPSQGLTRLLKAGAKLVHALCALLSDCLPDVRREG